MGVSLSVVRRTPADPPYVSLSCRPGRVVTHGCRSFVVRPGAVRHPSVIVRPRLIGSGGHPNLAVALWLGDQPSRNRRNRRYIPIWQSRFGSVINNLVSPRIVLQVPRSLHQRVTCDAGRGTCDVLTCDVWRATCNVWRVPRSVRRVTCNVQHPSTSTTWSYSLTPIHNAHSQRPFTTPIHGLTTVPHLAAWADGRGRTVGRRPHLHLLTRLCADDGLHRPQVRHASAM